MIAPAAADEDRAKLEAEGRKPHCGGSSSTTIWWSGIDAEPSPPSPRTVRPVLIREDGSYLYTFCSIVDDIEFGITHIIRGEDHVVNAAVQIEITRT